MSAASFDSALCSQAPTICPSLHSGIRTAARRLEIRSDTTLTVRLDINPILLDSLRVATRYVNIQGYLKEQATGKSVPEASVYATQNRHAKTKLAGHFEFKRVPANVPFEIQIMSFAFEPVRISLVPERDATLRIQLQVDTMVQRLIAEQSQRLEERAVATVGKAFSIGRDQLLQQREGTLSETLGEIMRYAPYSLSSPTRCVFIDEKLATAEVVFMLFPEEIQRVEFLFNGGMMRIYTRRFMASMVGAPVKLERPSFSAVTRPHGTGRTSECFLLVTLCLDAAGIMSMAGRRCNPQLLRIVQSLATDRNEVIARGVTESDLIAKTQKIAADGLAGVLPLPRREHRDPNIPGGAT